LESLQYKLLIKLTSEIFTKALFDPSWRTTVKNLSEVSTSHREIVLLAVDSFLETFTMKEQEKANVGI